MKQLQPLAHHRLQPIKVPPDLDPAWASREGVEVAQLLLPAVGIVRDAQQIAADVDSGGGS